MTAFDWVNADTRKFMSRGYLEGEETIEARVAGIASAFEVKLTEMGLHYEKAHDLGQCLYDVIANGWVSLSSPVWANYGRKRGLPISCNGSYIPDSIEGMKLKDAEIAVMTKHGSGTSAYLGAIRPRGTPVSAGGYADGVSLPAGMHEATIGLISQGNVRRGNIADYYPIEGDDFWEFIGFREEGSPIQNISLGVTVTDAFMRSVMKREAEPLKRWAAVLKKRFETGYPYIVFIDTVNKDKPECYKDMPIYASNLCAEIALPSSVDESFVCCLSSMNLDRYDEWKDTNAVEVMTYFLDTVIQEYIDKTEGMMFMEAPRLFAIRHRALGLGTLGYHSYLQRNSIAWTSNDAGRFNKESHKLIREKAEKASKQLASWFGEPEVCKGTGRRNTTLMAIAPTTSSSFILGQVSPSIEPLASNYFTKDLAKGAFTYRNPELAKVLDGYGRNDEATWMQILDKGGSVQHLDFLSEHEKEVFKTFSEIAPIQVVTQAAVRQPYIDQSQSLNLMIHPDAPLKEVNELMFLAWQMGVKSLYYQRGTNPAQEAVKNIMHCSACEA